jgi:hypothetical protein
MGPVLVEVFWLSSRRARSVCNRLVGPLENVPMLLRPKLSAVVLLRSAFVVCYGAVAVLCWNRPLFGLSALSQTIWTGLVCSNP